MMQENNLPEAPMELYAQKAWLGLSGAPARLSAGMAGVVQVCFTCSADWTGLQKTAVFTNGMVSVDVPEEDWEDAVCTVPQQVLAMAGKTVLVGLYGTDGEQTVLPTVWCSLGRVEAGTVPSCLRAMPPEAPIWAQLSQRLGALTPCTVRVSANASNALSADKTPAALSAAVQAGTPIRLVDAEGLCFTLVEASQTQAVFTGISCENGCFYAVRYVINAQQAVTRSQQAVSDFTISGEISASALSEAVLWQLGRYAVTVTEEDGSYSADQSPTEIYNAHQANAEIYLVGPELQELPLLQSINMQEAVFGGIVVNASSGTSSLVMYRITQNSVTRIQRTCGGMLATISQSGLSYRCDKSNTEIYSAYQQGMQVNCLTPDGTLLPLTHCSANDAWFSGCADDPDDAGQFSAQGWRLENNTATPSAISLQTQEISDAGSYFTGSTVEAALQELGAELHGINTLLGGGIA